jgi:hypothetical protein
MKLDGYPPERIKKTRDHYAKMNRTSEQRQAEIDKVFGRFNTKTKSVKKVLKVVKKRNVGQGDVP